MRKTLYGVGGFIIILCMVYFYIDNYDKIYSIRALHNDIEQALEETSDLDVVIKEHAITDNKLHFVFTTTGGTVGSGELVRGWNNKYKVVFFGYGTNGIRERIVETDKGQYLKLAGKNSNNIGRIRAFIEDEVYDITIPDNEYYIVMTSVRATDREFTTAKIIYDRFGNEMDRINLPVE